MKRIQNIQSRFTHYLEEKSSEHLEDILRVKFVIFSSREEISRSFLPHWIFRELLDSGCWILLSLNRNSIHSLNLKKIWTSWIRSERRGDGSSEDSEWMDKWWILAIFKPAFIYQFFFHGQIIAYQRSLQMIKIYLFIFWTSNDGF